MSAALGALAGLVTAAFSAGGVAGAIVRIGVSLVVSSLIGSQQKKPGSGSRGSTFMIRQSDVARRLVYGETRVGTIWFYAETDGHENRYLWLALGICEGPIESIESIYFDDAEVPLVQTGTDANGIAELEAPDGSNYEDKILIKKHLGTPGDPADADLVAMSDDWTTAHTLDGVAYLVVKLKHSTDAFPAGLPNISVKVKGKNDIYDPRDSSTGYSPNSALCLADYLTTAKVGPGADYATEIDANELIVAANVCDEAVTLAAGGTESRYETNGVVHTEDNPEDVVEGLKRSMAGRVVYVGGKFQVIAGAYEAPTFEITEDMLTGPVSVSNKLPKRDRINTVRGAFRAPQNKYQTTDFPAVTSSAYVAADGGEIAADIDLEFTTSPATAQRLAKIDLERGRGEIRVNLEANLRALPAQAGRFVMLTIPRFGWAQKIFLVESSAIGSDSDGRLIVPISLREWRSSTYSWNPATEEKEVTDAPSITLNIPRVAIPVPSQEGADYDPGDYPLSITLTSATAGATIRYSKTTIPSNDSSESLYSGAISIAEGENLFARAFLDDLDRSLPMSESYT